MSDLEFKVKAALHRLQDFQKDEGYYLAFSGGKDSVVCKALLDMANVKYDAHYRVTSVDPPELVRFIRDEHPDISRDIPRYETRRGWEGRPVTMWNLIPWKMMPPTRIVRYCCQFLKEDGGDGRMTVTGVRWAESHNRRQNQGLITIMGRKAGKELKDNPDFTSTNRGGGTQQRQYRKPPRDRAVLQKAQNHNKPDHRLGRSGCLGFYKSPRDSLLQPL